MTGTSNTAANICTRGLKAAVNTAPRFLTHHDIPTKHNPDPIIPCIINHTLAPKSWNRVPTCSDISDMSMYTLTANNTIKMSDFFLNIQMESSLSILELKMAAWMALNKAMMAVLEYWQGYLFPILVWRMNHDDQQIVPANKATHPIAHLPLPKPESIFTSPSMASGKWNRGIPLYTLNRMAPPTHTNAPTTLALPLLHFMLTLSKLESENKPTTTSDLSLRQENKRDEKYYGMLTHPNGKAIKNVRTGTRLRKAHENMADVYSMPRRKRYCVTDALHAHTHNTMLHKVVDFQ